MILSSTINWEGYTVGSKAQRLQVLRGEVGLRVPDFFVLPGEVMHEIETLDMAVALEQLQAERFAVRSAALDEDTNQTAHAGLFITKLNLTAGEVKSACNAVLADAIQKGVPAERFSLIVQVYLEPTIHGVVFSRDPRGRQGLLIEYVDAVGSVVAGEAVHRVRSLTGRAPSGTSFVYADMLFAIARRLEERFVCPQDIEWLVHDGCVQIVQSRDVTTISEARLNALRHIDGLLSQQKPFLFDQSNSIESISRPTPLMFSVLQWLYRAGGPVERAYAQLGLRYTATEQFTVLGNQLFIDKQAETRSLFPAMGHLARGQTEPGVERFRGLFTTIANIQRFKSLTPDISLENFSALEEFLSSSLCLKDVTAALTEFDTWYPQVFRINVLATLATGKTLPPVANDLFCFESNPLDISGHMLGNSLSLDDQSEFTAKALRIDGTDSPLQAWSKCREFGRWVTVKLVTHLRAVISALDREDVWWMTLDEVCVSQVHHETTLQRKQQWERFQVYDFPPVVASFLSEESHTSVGISAGVARGLLTQPALWSASGESQILLVDTLSPDLVKFLPHVAGVVSRTGGVLSHFAIMAREHKVPVVVMRESVNELMGEQVIIDGENGTVRKFVNE